MNSSGSGWLSRELVTEKGPSRSCKGLSRTILTHVTPLALHSHHIPDIVHHHAAVVLDVIRQNASRRDAGVVRHDEHRILRLAEDVGELSVDLLG